MFNRKEYDEKRYKLNKEAVSKIKLVKYWCKKYPFVKTYDDARICKKLQKTVKLFMQQDYNEGIMMVKFLQKVVDRASEAG
jgi:hypothetical protein